MTARPSPASVSILLGLLAVLVFSVACPKKDKQPSSQIDTTVDGTGGKAVSNFRDLSGHVYKNSFEAPVTFDVKEVDLWLDSCLGTATPTVTVRLLDSGATNLANQSASAPDGLCHDHNAMHCRQDSECPDYPNEVCNPEPGWTKFPMNGIKLSSGQTYYVSVDQTSFSCKWGIMGSDTLANGDAYEDNAVITENGVPLDFAFKVSGTKE